MVAFELPGRTPVYAISLLLGLGTWAAPGYGAAGLRWLAGTFLKETRLHEPVKIRGKEA